MNSRMVAVGQRLVSKSAVREPPAGYACVDEWDFDAWLLKGRGFFATRGLCGLLDSDDELAYLMAHLIGHSVLGHAPHLPTSVPRAAGALVVYDPGSGRISPGAITFEPGHYRESEEREADKCALELMARAGYHPVEGVKFTRKMRVLARQLHGLGGFWMTHPDYEGRVGYLTEIAGHLVPTPPLVDPPDLPANHCPRD